MELWRSRCFLPQDVAEWIEIKKHKLNMLRVIDEDEKAKM